MKKIHLIVGTRPDAIKMAPVYKALKSKAGLDVKLVSTGQHKELLQQVFTSFDMTPDFDLKIMKPGQSLSQLTMAVLNGLENLYQEDKPDIVLAHGDTTTCYSSALSAFYHHIPFFHVEAGLRTYNLDSPFPEEFNRQSVASLATHHFAPTEKEKLNLIRDGIFERVITVTGGTIHDAVSDIQKMNSDIADLKKTKQTVVVTLHRREHADQLARMMMSIREAALKRNDVIFICPLHPNPLVQKAAQEILQNISNIILMDALIYPEFIRLLASSDLVLTDSGGVQEEASFLGKKVLVLREISERMDGLKEGLAHIIGNDPATIEKSILYHLSSEAKNSFIKLPAAKRASDIVADTVLERSYA